MLMQLNKHVGIALTFYRMTLLKKIGAPVAQWVKRWPTDLADRV